MTAAQNEQWQRAIPLLDYLDFHALSDSGLQESEERLAGWGVPGWAMQLRGHFITLGREDGEAWTPTFALRSETALIGLQIRYPTSDVRVAVYWRVLLRFFQEALHPIVAWAQEGDDRRRNGYQAVTEVHELCERLLQSPGPSSPADQLAWSQALKEASDPESDQYLNEIGASLELANLLLSDWQHIVFFPEHWQTWWSKLAQREVALLTRQLHRHHRRRLEEKSGVSVSYEPIATAYLAALESACPAPEWLIQLPNS